MVEAIKYSSQGEQIGKVVLPAGLFEVETAKPQVLMYEVIKMYNANQRHGTVGKKNRSMVSGSNRKLFRQKGTGNARVGMRRTPIRVGGGMAFGIVPKDWYRPIPKKKKRLALKLALSERAKNGQVLIVEDFQFSQPSTRDAKNILNKMIGATAKTLIITDGHNLPVVRSFRNLEKVKCDRADGLYAYEILNCQYLILTESALKKAEEVFA
jgi:large subunit ribosomal protein L4